MKTREDFINALKNNFKTGATPTEADYMALIEMAAVGLKALGVPVDSLDPTKARVGAGLKYANDRKLTLLLASKSGLALDGGLKIIGGAGIAVTEAGVGLNVKAPLTVDSDKPLRLNFNPPLELQRSGTPEKVGLGVKLDKSGGLAVGDHGLKINLDENYSGLKIDGNILKIKCATGENLLTIGTAGLQLTEVGLNKLKTNLMELRSACDALLTYKTSDPAGAPSDETLKIPLTGALQHTLKRALDAASMGSGELLGWSRYITKHLEDALNVAVTQYRQLNTDAVLNESRRWSGILARALKQAYDLGNSAGASAGSSSGYSTGYSSGSSAGSSSGYSTGYSSGSSAGSSSGYSTGYSSGSSAGSSSGYSTGYSSGSSAGSSSGYSTGYSSGSSAGSSSGYSSGYSTGYSSGSSSGSRNGKEKVQREIIHAIKDGWIGSGFSSSSLPDFNGNWSKASQKCIASGPKDGNHFTWDERGHYAYHLSYNLFHVQDVLKD
ncbi:hypothetical protein [Burkholderia sp. SIMBA_062]|uniref:hypothetical protein n=1 Tax=Burkholderia sp. SIMBA_062 TaxID=3085803 RepID=UPI003979180B